MTDGFPTTPDGRPSWYGRRHGHKLRGSRQRLIDEVLPRLRLDPSGSDGPLALDEIFGTAKKAYRLEIGFGGGEHLAGQALADPDIGFIGCEPFVNGVASLLSVIDEHKIDNIRIYDDDARIILGRFPAQAFSAIYILFPDPWPKVRHRRRRIIQPVILDQVSRLLTDGGHLVFATDHMGYAEWALARAMRHADFEWTAERPGDWQRPPAGWIETRYEAKAKRKGDQPTYLTFRRLARPESVT